MTPCPEICSYDCEYEAQELDQKPTVCPYGHRAPHYIQDESKHKPKYLWGKEGLVRLQDGAEPIINHERLSLIEKFKPAGAGGAS